MIRPCVIGLGYVGLPLLINLSKKFKIVGYDNDKIRISKLRKSIDTFKEFNKKKLKNKNLYYSNNLKDIKDSNFILLLFLHLFIEIKTQSNLFKKCIKIFKQGNK